MGRPSTYTPEIADEICERLSQGETLRSICSEDGMPAASTVCLWVTQDPAFAERYARVRDLGLDRVAEQTIEIADDKSEDPNSRRIRVDARKWLLSKMAPKRYGERLELASDPKSPLIPGKVLIELVKVDPPSNG